MKSADQEKSKPHHREKRRERSTSPTYDHHRRRSSPSDDDDLSHIYPVKNMISQVAHEHEDDPEIYNGEGEDYISDTLVTSFFFIVLKSFFVVAIVVA